MGHGISPFDTHIFLPLPTLVLTNRRTHLDVAGSLSSHTSHASSSPPLPSPTQLAHSSARTTSAGSRDNIAEEHDRLSSLCFLTPPARGNTLPVSGIITDRDANGSASLGHPSSVAISLKRVVRCVYYLSPSPSGDTNFGSDIARNYSIQKGNNAGVRPDSAEPHLNVEPFAFKQLQLVALIDPKNLENLDSLGGVKGLLHGLKTDRVCGLNTKLSQPGSPDLETNNAVTPFGVEWTLMTTLPAVSTASLGRSASLKFSVPHEATIEDRQRVYNILPHCLSKRLLRLSWSWLALHDKVLVSRKISHSATLNLLSTSQVFLSIAAVASLALGVCLDFSSTRAEGELPVDWVEGIAIVLAILIAVIVGSLKNWRREEQFKTRSEKNEDRLVKVIYDGRERQIHAHEVVVGDVVLLEPGDVIPWDSVFLSGHNMPRDESSATGESDSIKVSYEECIALRVKRFTELDTGGPSVDGELLGRADCFIASGSKVLEGVGSYVVIAVGTKSLGLLIALPLI
jgi:hypothetical protein